MFCCILGCLLFLICIEFVYLYFPVLFCLSVSVKRLAVKTASEMTYTVSSRALNSTPTPIRLLLDVQLSRCGRKHYVSGLSVRLCVRAYSDGGNSDRLVSTPGSNADVNEASLIYHTELKNKKQYIKKKRTICPNKTDTLRENGFGMSFGD